MSAFARVLAQPASLAARYALLAEWQATGNPQAELLERQLAYRLISGTNLRSDRAHHLAAEIQALIEAHGAAWAGRVHELVPTYRFHRGLVAEVRLPADQLLDVLPELVALQPIQHVSLLAPWGDLEAIVTSPWLARLSSLRIDGAGEAFGDYEAILLARNPHIANLADLTLCSNSIGQVGAEALVASPHLADAKLVSLEHNPYDPTPRVIDDGDGVYVPFRPPAADEVEATYGTRPWLALPTGYLPTWPPGKDELALHHDYVADEQLARLEQLAVEVDRLEAGSDAEQVVAGAKRQRLLIELDVYGLLTGRLGVGRRVAGYATLHAYHEACLAMASYHASAARRRLVGPAPRRPTEGHVSLDWFRTPSNYLPVGVTPHKWLALCERNFIAPLPTKTGTRFVRLEGSVHTLAYRIEATAEPKLWRALPA